MKYNFKICDRIKVARKLKRFDYRYVYPKKWRDIALYGYSLNKTYTIVAVRKYCIEINNSALIPNHLVIKL